MELYQTFTTIQDMVWYISPVWTLEILFSCVFSACGVWLALFILQGFGLMKMAKNRNIKRKWLAFVPFFNLIYIGKLVGTCIVFGRPMKRAGIYAMIAQLLSTLIALAFVIIYLHLCLAEGLPKQDQLGSLYWDNLSYSSQILANIMNAFSYVLPILQLIYTVFIAILSFALYKKYAPNSYFILGLVTIFIPVSRYIIVFVLRNRQAINFEEYMRKRREEYIRQQQQYGGGYNSYGAPYRNPYGNPYGNPYANPQQRPPQAEENPFSDFSEETEKKPDANDPDGFFD